MGFMTKAEINKLRQKTGAVDSGITKRTCITCSARNNCAGVLFSLHKTETKGCIHWHPGKITCGVCKHSVHESQGGYRLTCTCNDPSVKKVVEYDDIACADEWELSPELKRLG